MLQDLDRLEEIVANGTFLSLREALEKAGFKAEVITGDMPMPPIWYEVSKDGVSYIIANKQYINNADRIVGEIAIGINE